MYKNVSVKSLLLHKIRAKPDREFVKTQNYLINKIPLTPKLEMGVRGLCMLFQLTIRSF